MLSMSEVRLSTPESSTLIYIVNMEERVRKDYGSGSGGSAVRGTALGK
jgi:hypothetical protein